MTRLMRTLSATTALSKATDATQVRPVLERALSAIVGIDLRVAGLGVPRVFLRTDKPTLIQYTFELKGPAPRYSGPVILYGELHGSSPASRESEMGQGRSVYLEELQLNLHLFPFDNRLTELSNCFGPATGELWLQPADLQLADSGLRFSPQRVLAYRLGKRCVIGGVLTYPVSVGSPPVAAILRVATPGHAARSVVSRELLDKTLKNSAAGQRFTLPRILFTDISRGLILSEAVSSRTLHSMLSATECPAEAFPTACQRTGYLLREFQARDFPPDASVTRHTALNEKSMLENNITALASEAPQISRKLQAALSALEGLPEGSEAAQTSLSHRDFYDKQLFAGEDTITLIDFDTLSIADPYLDVANFLAHLRLRQRQGLLHERGLSRAQSRFMAGYLRENNALSEIQIDRLGWWYRATLIRLAALYAVRPKWCHLSDTLTGDCQAGLRLTRERS